ncbi:MAG TPA: hypothetical protein VEB03_01145 [Candidatus Nanoarchaeia archaeon]|nr:hypothetical protein [Candidatus Nanoarchaeia archaeon]
MPTSTQAQPISFGAARPRCLFVALFVCALAICGAAQQKVVDATSNEPFNSFRLLDRQLSTLDRQLSATKESLLDARTGKVATVRERRNRQPWSAAVQDAHKTVASITSAAARLRTMYNHRRQPFAVRAFGDLEHRARLLGNAVRELCAARNAEDSLRTLEAAEKARVQLVLRYQAISGGYAAVHCSRGVWACCEPKNSNEVKDTPQACSWSCVKAPTACKAGFLGPQSRAAQ